MKEAATQQFDPAECGSGRPSVTRVLANLLAFLAAAVLVVSAIAKLVVLHDFELTLSQWSIVPDWSPTYIALSLPPIELGVATSLMFSKRKKRPAMLFLAMMLLFTSAYGIEWAVADRPDCSCFGILQAYANKVGVLRSVIVRNSILAACVLPCILAREKVSDP